MPGHPKAGADNATFVKIVTSAGRLRDVFEQRDVRNSARRVTDRGRAPAGTLRTSRPAARSFLAEIGGSMRRRSGVLRVWAMLPDLTYESTRLEQDAHGRR